VRRRGTGTVICGLPGDQRKEAPDEREVETVADARRCQTGEPLDRGQQRRGQHEHRERVEHDLASSQRAGDEEVRRLTQRIEVLPGETERGEHRKMQGVRSEVEARGVGLGLPVAATSPTHEAKLDAVAADDAALLPTAIGGPPDRSRRQALGGRASPPPWLLRGTRARTAQGSRREPAGLDVSPRVLGAGATGSRRSDRRAGAAGAPHVQSGRRRAHPARSACPGRRARWRPFPSAQGRSEGRRPRRVSI
jgi:hypothetical protein